MLKNYITIAINNLLKNKLHSFINILGLSIGLTVCLLMTLFVHDQFSYDRGWEKADLIYRVNDVKRFGSLPDAISPFIPAPALPALKEYFPEDIELGTRITNSWGDIQIEDKIFKGSIYKVDKEFIRIFQAEVLKGSLESTMRSPRNIALDEKSAAKYFGDKEPIGETITFKGEEQYRVTAVYRFISPKTVLGVSCFSLLVENGTESTEWDSFSSGVPTYIRLSETADIETFRERLKEFIDRIVPVTRMIRLSPDQKLSEVQAYSLQNISDIHLNPVGPTGPQIPGGIKTVVTVFLIIAVLVLFIACVNFIILTTAKATQRAREVAMRKVVGARFRQLLVQFLGESMLLSLIAILIAVGMTELALPFFESFVYTELSVPYSSPGSYIFVLLLLIFVGLLGGLYPAVVLSRFSPNRALRANQTTRANGSFKLKNILVILQFSISIVLIIATAASYLQAHYAIRHDPGFNPDKILVLKLYNNNQKLKTLQQELLKMPAVKNAGLSSQVPSDDGGGIMVLLLRQKTEGPTPSEACGINSMEVDYNFFKTYDIPLLSGRFFIRDMDQEISSDAAENGSNIAEGITRIIINSAAARQLGFASSDKAVGGILEPGILDPQIEYHIIGVVKDFRFKIVNVKPAPEIFFLSTQKTTFLTVRYLSSYQSAVDEIRSVWHSVCGDMYFTPINVKQAMTAPSIPERQQNKALIIFALLSVFIASMGLFGMASFTVDRRVKEIGLRKVMGAKVKDIVKLLSWQFLKPVLIANIIAWPTAILLMQSWSESFPYRFSPMFMIPICMVSGLIALIIAWFTVAGNTTRVAKSKPIKALRDE